MSSPEEDGSAAVLQFWLGSGDEAEAARLAGSLWWRKDPAIDAAIGQRFGELRRRALAGELKHWEALPRSRLALIILVDQFSRNMFRGSPESFHHDPVARRWCTGGIAAGMDRVLPPAGRLFFYLPLEHSECEADQELSVRLFRGLLAEGPEALKPMLADNLEFAERHRDIIRRFGRFPHRNAILGRPSTPEETAFLALPGSGFF